MACILSMLSPAAFAQGASVAIEPVEEITVRGSRLDAAPSPTGTMPAPLPASTSDTASLLRNVPGISLQGAGGVSSLPAIHGLADDRVRVQVNGMDLVSACANHMNPPLSYIDPVNVGAVKVFAGLTPVSVGGDSLAGTIIVDSADAQFAQPGGDTVMKGQAGAFYRSDGVGGSVSATLAGESLSLIYSGAMARADNYDAGGRFKASGPAAAGRKWLAGDTVGSSYYETVNQSVGLALQHDNHVARLDIARQHIPEQGFPNQRMDMTDNDGRSFSLLDIGTFDWGTLNSRAYYETTRHSMNFGDDKQFWYGDAPGMPMETKGRNTGGRITANVALGERGVLRAGVGVQLYELDDWWPPSGTGAMMSPNTFWNIRNGERDRYDAFAEWERNWAPAWTTLLGVRSGTVRMNTGDVQGYSNTNGMGMMTTQYLSESTAFNDRDHARIDHNVDLTALARYAPTDAATYEFGYARKSRSPNLYERYTWSTSGMSMRMVNFAGDGNGYVGNLDLEPEVAHTVSATADWHDAGREHWAIQITPFLTYVNDYVDARRCNSANANCGAANQTATDSFVYLQFVNQNARLYGADIAAFRSLAAHPRYGTFTINGLIGYVDGKNRTTGDNLYNVMPINLKLSLEHRLGNWTSAIEGQFVDAKDEVSAVRNELKTGSYGLMNLRSSYAWKRVSVDVGIDNLFDTQYEAPLGGAYLGQGQTMSATGVPYGIAVPGAGISFYTGLNIQF